MKELNGKWAKKQVFRLLYGRTDLQESRELMILELGVAERTAIPTDSKASASRWM